MKVIFPSLFKNLDVGSLQYEVCEFAKNKHVLFLVSNKMSHFPFSLIHTTWASTNVSNISSAKWFLTLIDNCTKVTWVLLLKQKSKVSSIFIMFALMVKNQFGVIIKRIGFSNAKNYFTFLLNSFLPKEGIIMSVHVSTHPNKI